MSQQLNRLERLRLRGLYRFNSCLWTQIAISTYDANTCESKLVYILDQQVYLRKSLFDAEVHHKVQRDFQRYYNNRQQRLYRQLQTVIYCLFRTLNSVRIVQMNIKCRLDAVRWLKSEEAINITQLTASHCMHTCLVYTHLAQHGQSTGRLMLRLSPVRIR